MFGSTLSCPHWDPCHTQVPTPWTGCHTMIPACGILASLEAAALRQLRCLCGPNPTLGAEGRVLIPGPWWLAEAPRVAHPACWGPLVTWGWVGAEGRSRGGAALAWSHPLPVFSHPLWGLVREAERFPGALPLLRTLPAGWLFAQLKGVAEA